MLNLNKAINSILTGATGVTKICSNIYPLVIPEKTPAPLIVFERQGENIYTKDYFNSSNNEVTITIIANNYSDSVSIALAVDLAMQNAKRSTKAGINLIDIKLVNYNEAFQDDLFMQLLKYSVIAS